MSVIITRIWRAMPFAFINFYSYDETMPEEWYEAEVMELVAFKSIFLLLFPT